MSDSEPFYSPFHRPPPRKSRPAEPLFEFVRASDAAPMSCELRFHGESFGWEATFLERGELMYSRRFERRDQAVRWATVEREAMQGKT
jgi:hypothetical protein